jgi:histidyl-tRNA synthetase
VFELESDRLGAQRGVGGGGRYDRLVEELGGPPTPGVGWAAGVERMLLAAEPGADGAFAAPVFVALAKRDRSREAFRLLRELREAGLHAEMEQTGRSLKGQLRHADRMGARAVAIVGDGIEVKDMASGEQRPVSGIDEAVRTVSA